MTLKYSLDDAIREYGRPEFVPLYRSIHQQESGGGTAKTDQPNYAGAIGEMQVTKPTFDTLKKAGRIPADFDFHNPKHTMIAGVANVNYNSDILGTTDLRKLAAAYYGGPGVIRDDGTIRTNIRDPKNPKAPTVGEYANTVAARAGGAEEPATPRKTAKSALDPYEDPTRPEFYTGKRSKEFEVTGPDGRKFDVTTPSSATLDDAIRYVQQKFYQEAPKPVETPPEEPGLFKTIQHSATRSAGPLAGGLLGAGAAMQAVAPISAGMASTGVGALPAALLEGGAGLVGGIGGALLAGKGQEKLLEAKPGIAEALGIDEATRAAEEAAHPHAAMLTEVGMNLLGARPTAAGLRALIGRTTLTNDAEAAAKLIRQARIQSAVGAGVFGGIDVGQQLMGDEPFDPMRALASFGVGALSQKETRLGKMLMGAGRAPVGAFMPEQYRSPKTFRDMLEGAETPPAPETPAEVPAETPVVEGEQPKRRRKKAGAAPSTEDILGAQEVPDEAGIQPTPVAGGESTVPAPAGTADVGSTGVPVQRGAADQLGAEAPVSEGLADTGVPAKSPDGGAEVSSAALKAETIPETIPETKAKPVEEVPVEGTEQARADLEGHVNKLEQKLDDAVNNGEYDRAQEIEQEIAVTKNELAKTAPKTEPVEMVEVKPTKAFRKEEGTAPKPKTKAKVEPLAETIPETTPETEVPPSERMQQPAEKVHKNLREAIESGSWNNVLTHLSGEHLPESKQTIYHKLAQTLRRGPDYTMRGEGGKGVKNIDYDQINKKGEKRGININAEGVEGHDAAEIQRLKDSGKLAEYDPATNTIHVTKEGMSDEVLLHETVHAATVRTLKDFEREVREGFPTRTKLEAEAAKKGGGTDAAAKFQDRMDAAAHINNLYNIARNRSVLGQPLLKKYPQAFKSVYEFVSYAMTHNKFQEDLSKLYIEKPRYTTKSMRYTHGLGGVVRTLWDDFTQSLAKMFGLDKGRATTAKGNKISSLEAKIERLQQERAEVEAKPETDETWERLSELEGSIDDATAELNAAKRSEARTTDVEKEGNLLLEASHAISNIIRSPRRTAGVGKLDVVAPGAPPKKVAKAKKPEVPAEKLVENRAKVEAQKVQSQSLGKKIAELSKKYIGTSYREMKKNLQNSKVWLSDLEEELRKRGVLRAGVNDVYTADVLKKFKPEEQSNPSKNRILDAVGKYAEATGRKWNEVSAEFAEWMTALTEPKLREYHYALNVPLDNVKKIYQIGKERITAADYRKRIVEAIPHTKSDAEAAQLRKALDDVVAKHKKQGPDGSSPDPIVTKAGNTIDITDPAYNVAGAYTQKQLADLRAQYNRALADPKLKPLVENVIKATREAREKVIELNRKSGHWGDHVDRAVAFQDRGDTYFPLKGSIAEGYDTLRSARLAGEAEPLIQAQEGRFSQSDNPLTQTMADLDLAVNRANRSEMLKRVENLVREGHIKGKVLKSINVQDRADFADRVGKKQRNKILFRYNPDGKVSVIRIDEPEFANAVKGVALTQGPLMDALGKTTRAMALGFTHYNPFYAPKNFIRDLATNLSSVAGGRYGMAAAGKIAARAVMSTAMGNPFRAARAARLIAKGDITKLAQLAKTNSFYKNIYEYYKAGGIQTFKQQFSNLAETRQLAAEIEGRTFGKTRDSIDRLFTIWNNSFELMNREAAYSVLRDAELKNKIPESEAMDTAAAYTKNLFNMEEHGTYSKPLSSWFTLFKAEATGGVRTIEAFRPMWQTAEAAMKDRVSAKPMTEAEKQTFIKNHNKLRFNAIATAMTAMGMGMFAYNRAKASAPTDEEGRNIVATDKHALWARNMRIPAKAIFGDDAEKILGKGNEFISLPWGFGAGSFASMGAQMAALLGGDIDVPEAALNMGTAAMDAFVPVPVAGVELARNHPVGWAVATLAPSVARPALEMAWNMDEFGRQVYNSRLGKYGEAYSSGDYVAEVYKDVAASIREKFDIDMSPSAVQFFMQNYVSGAAGVAEGAYNQYLTVTDQKDFDSRDLNPLRSFIARKSSYDARKFSEIEPEIKEFSTRIAAYKAREDDEGLDRYLDKHPGADEAVRYYNKVRNRINELQGKINAINASGMTPRERAEEVEDLKLERDMWMADMVETYNEMKD